MSHNVLTVNDDSFDRMSELTLSPAAISEIRISTNGSMSSAYSNSPATALNNSTLYFYDSSPTNSISGATISSSSNWIDSVTLPAGSYLIQSTFSVQFTASGQFAFQLYDGLSSLGTRAQIGASLQFNTESCHAIAQCIVTITSSTTFSLVSTSNSTNLKTIADQGVIPSEESWLYVRQL